MQITASVTAYIVLLTKDISKLLSISYFSISFSAIHKGIFSDKKVI